MHLWEFSRQVGMVSRPTYAPLGVLETDRRSVSPLHEGLLEALSLLVSSLDRINSEWHRARRWGH